MMFGISVPKIKPKYFECKDYSSSEFGNVLKKARSKMKKPRIIGFTAIEKVDDDHASDTITCKS